MLNYINGWGNGMQWGPQTTGRSMNDMKSFAYDRPQEDPMDCYIFKEGGNTEELPWSFGGLGTNPVRRDHAYALPLIYPGTGDALTNPELYRRSNSLEICEMITQFLIRIKPCYTVTVDLVGELPTFWANYRFILAEIKGAVVTGPDPGGIDTSIVANYFGMQYPDELAGEWYEPPVTANRWPNNTPYESARWGGVAPERTYDFVTLYDSHEKIVNGAPNTGLDTVLETPSAIWPGAQEKLQHWWQGSVKTRIGTAEENYLTVNDGQLVWIVCCSWSGQDLQGVTDSYINVNPPEFDIRISYKFRNLTYGKGTCAPGCYAIPEHAHEEEEKEKREKKVELGTTHTSSKSEEHVVVDDLVVHSVVEDLHDDNEPWEGPDINETIDFAMPSSSTERKGYNKEIAQQSARSKRTPLIIFERRKKKSKKASSEVGGKMKGKRTPLISNKTRKKKSRWD